MEKLSAALFIFAGLMFLNGSYSFYREGQNIAALGFLISGLLFIYSAIKYFISHQDMSLKPEKGEALKKTNTKVAATILNIKHVTNIRVNQRAPYVIIAQGVNPITNQSQIFQSYYIWDDILFSLKDKKTVDVYIDSNNPKKYYMDIQTLVQTSNPTDNIQNQ